MAGTASETKYPDAKSQTSFQDGLEFQDFVCEQLLKKAGLVVQCFCSRKYQFNRGESVQAVEIKLDNLCLETGRLSIEIAEKSKASNLHFVPSGIYRDDGAWLYIQGNYQKLFIFAKNILILLHESGRYEEHELPTIRKFYLPLDDAERYAAKVIEL